MGAFTLSRPLPRSPVTVGDLVRHIRTGGIGLIVEHTMYDANSGGFRVKFNHPVDNVSSFDGRVINQIAQIFDRHDEFEKLS